ncbi:MAG: hypothetical protein ACREBW_06290, partial [Candidatus Micrarchaeaceae archaeon]
MTKEKFVFNCAVCGNPYQHGPHRYEGAQARSLWRRILLRLLLAEQSRRVGACRRIKASSYFEGKEPAYP